MILLRHVFVRREDIAVKIIDHSLLFETIISFQQPILLRHVFLRREYVAMTIIDLFALSFETMVSF